MIDEINERLRDMHRGEDIVLGCGDRDARIVIIGEAPGKNEIEEGVPFVGKAGRNLDGFLSFAGIDRSSVYITNAVKFRPVRVSPKGTVSNRTPSREEIMRERDLLIEEVRAVGPEIVVTLGNTPLRSWLGDMGASIGLMHGRAFEGADGITLFPLYHPASIIYNRALKDVFEEDLRALAALTEAR